MFILKLIASFFTYSYLLCIFDSPWRLRAQTTNNYFDTTEAITMNFISTTPPRPYCILRKCECIYDLLGKLLKIDCSNRDLSLNDLFINRSNPNSSVITQLSIFDISSNNIEEIRNDTFFNFTKLQLLDLSSNSIKAIQDYSFATLKSLEDLNLSSNKIDTITNSTFAGLENSLKTLSLSSNSLTNFDISAFSFLNNLQTLDLKNNSGIVTSQFVIIKCSTTTVSTIFSTETEANNNININNQFP